jgi:uncharacterized membrane protein YgdD (TMEM256/DUF423 family)
MTARLLIAASALLLALATALGAIASHALGGSLDADALHSFETAVEYQFIHSLGLLAVAILAERQASRPLLIAAALLLAGILLFCGGVYASSLDGPGWIARLAPAGGMILIGSWLLAAAALLHAAFTSRKQAP